MRPRELPDRARVVIIGGGVGGTSIAYHLAELGERDVVLVDRDELTSGSTFHSAGLVGQLRSSVSLTKMMMYSVELYRRLEAEGRTSARGGPSAAASASRARPSASRRSIARSRGPRRSACRWSCSRRRRRAIGSR